MSFGADLRLFAEKVERRAENVFLETVFRVHESVTEGSPTTGAPGQPVDTGFLKASWLQEYPEQYVGEVFTSAVYAPFIEDGAERGLTLRSKVGGFGSVKLTRANWDLVVNAAVEEVVR